MLPVVFLCGGFGTRLTKDILASGSQEFDNLLNLPKALVPVGKHDSLLSFWMQFLGQREVYIITNGLHYNQFLTWA